MTKLTTSDLIQVLSTIAIVAGIALVLVELRQGREIAEAQLISDQYAMQAALLTTIASIGLAPCGAR